MSSVDFYVCFFSIWILIGIILGYFMMKDMMNVISDEDDKSEKKSLMSELEKSCVEIAHCIGLSPIMTLFIVTYAIGICLWPYLLFGKIKNKLMKK